MNNNSLNKLLDKYQYNPIKFAIEVRLSSFYRTNLPVLSDGLLSL